MEAALQRLPSEGKLLTRAIIVTKSKECSARYVRIRASQFHRQFLQFVLYASPVNHARFQAQAQLVTNGRRLLFR